MFTNAKEESVFELVDSGLGNSIEADFGKLAVRDRHVHSEPIERIEVQTTASCDHSRNKEGTTECDVLRDEDGDSQLHLAIACGNEELSQRIIDVASADLINAQNIMGQTPIMLAVLVNMTPVIRSLIDKGADLGLCDCYGNNIIHLAADNGDERTLIEMFTRSSFVNMNKLSETYQILLEAGNFEGLTPFHVAIRREKLKFAKLLKEIGANVNAMDFKAGFTPLHHLVEHGNVHLLEQFIEEFHPELDMQSYSGITPLHLAMGEELVAAASILIINGANTGIGCADNVSWSAMTNMLCMT